MLCVIGYSQKQEDIYIELTSAWDGTFLIYDSHFALMDSAVVEPDIPKVFSFRTGRPDFYFLLPSRDTKYTETI